MIEISNEILAKFGADPKVYSDADKEKICNYAEFICNGDLNKILYENSVPETTIKSITENNMNTFKELRVILENISSDANKILKLFTNENNKSLPIDINTIIDNIVILCDNTNEIIQQLFEQVRKMVELQKECNEKLANLGMANLATMITDKKEFETAIYDAIENSFDYLNGLTGFLNNLNDKALICEMTINNRIKQSINKIKEIIDGKSNINRADSNCIKDECCKIQNEIQSILENQLQGGTI